jgi:hypothetical protein
MQGPEILVWWRVSEEGTLSVEWTLGRSRVGLYLEPNPADSGWHFVSLAHPMTAEYGPIETFDLPALLHKLWVAGIKQSGLLLQ